jgi:hypothetical protein
MALRPVLPVLVVLAYYQYEPSETTTVVFLVLDVKIIVKASKNRTDVLL